MGKPWRLQSRAEDELQEATASYLASLPESAIAIPFLAFHIANEARRGRAELGLLIRMGLRPGAADWAFAWAGGSAFIELKSATGKPTLAQRDFGDECREKGIPYSICRDLESFEMRLVGLDLIRHPLLKVGG